ncbi:MAG: queG [Clostridiales bacterium]|nr:queG [Clostridiales bacterium]
MKQRLLEFCNEIGIENAGIAHIGPYYDLEKILRNRIEKGHYTSFEERELERRIDPSLTMEGVKSIIVCLFPYFTGRVEDTNISKYTYPKDYHIVAREKLESIGEFLKSEIQGFEYKAFVDSGPLVDRYLVNIAGLGFYGINSHMITKEYGSYFFIGYILCNHGFEPDNSMDKTCIRCGECVKRCPGNAILGDFNINPNRCISYITQKKGELRKEEIRILNKNHMVFGCDICQDVCPHNKKIEHTKMEEFKIDLIYKLNYDEINSMSNKEFKRKYGDRAFSWRGKGIIIRNFEYLGYKE